MRKKRFLEQLFSVHVEYSLLRSLLISEQWRLGMEEAVHKKKTASKIVLVFRNRKKPGREHTMVHMNGKKNKIRFGSIGKQCTQTYSGSV